MSPRPPMRGGSDSRAAGRRRCSRPLQGAATGACVRNRCEAMQQAPTAATGTSCGCDEDLSFGPWTCPSPAEATAVASAGACSCLRDLLLRHTTCPCRRHLLLRQGFVWDHAGAPTTPAARTKAPAVPHQVPSAVPAAVCCTSCRVLHQVLSAVPWADWQLASAATCMLEHMHVPQKQASTVAAGSEVKSPGIRASVALHVPQLQAPAVDTGVKVEFPGSRASVAPHAPAVETDAKVEFPGRRASVAPHVPQLQAPAVETDAKVESREAPAVDTDATVGPRVVKLRLLCTLQLWKGMSGRKALVRSADRDLIARHAKPQQNTLVDTWQDPQPPLSCRLLTCSKNYWTGTSLALHQLHEGKPRAGRCWKVQEAACPRSDGAYLHSCRQAASFRGGKFSHLLEERDGVGRGKGRALNPNALGMCLGNRGCAPSLLRLVLFLALLLIPCHPVLLPAAISARRRRSAAADGTGAFACFVTGHASCALASAPARRHVFVRACAALAMLSLRRLACHRRLAAVALTCTCVCPHAGTHTSPPACAGARAGCLSKKRCKLVDGLGGRVHVTPPRRGVACIRVGANAAE
eukprot:359683-Chlamydomonas_euryale.AAC.6